MAPSPSPSILEDKAGMIHLGNFGGRRSVAIPYAPWACMELEQLDLLFATVCTTASISTSFLTESTTSSSSPPPPSSSPQPPPLPPRAQSQRREGNCMAHDMFFCKEQQRHHYAQLSQLKDLKRLAVKRAPTLALQKHDAGLDWTLASGMDQLSTLTELRVFIVPGEESMFGLAELKWAKQAWPKLEYIEGLKGCDEEIDQWQQENWADLIFK
ncbi:hypothetical protein DFQ27_007043 [Actinomortierella ambigua]|uniref:Uncharacterized protein n=1 Tax=Actinomortierella ambigua TaxID=1343610 RepID=A0A9P6UAU8_9FUNG|nr:hypothetical protein DFQ27_007043 [Actinomortierella ambigua]